MRTLLLAAFVLTLGSIIACSDDANTAPKPTVTVTQTETSGVQGFRDFAAQIQSAFETQDIDFFLSRAVTEEIVCSPEDVHEGGPGGPTCEFEGQEFQGFPIGRWQSEGGIVPVEAAVGQIMRLVHEGLPDESDEFGDGRPRVYAIMPDTDSASAVLTALIERPDNFAPGGPLRVVVILSWSFAEDRWEITRHLSAFGLAEEFLIPCETAAPYVSETWERYPDPSAAGPGVEACPVY